MVFDCEQIAGFSEVEFLLLNEVSNWPIVLTDQNSSQLIINRFDHGVEGVVQPESISIDANPRTGVDGEIWDVQATFRFLTRSESLEQLFDQYAHREGIVIAKLMNGFTKIYGSSSEPLFLTFKNEEGIKVDDASGLVVNIGGLTSQRPVYYTV